MGANDPQDMANLNPSYMVGRIYIENYILNIEAVGLMVLSNNCIQNFHLWQHVICGNL